MNALARFFSAVGASVTAALEKFAAEMTEAAKELPDREYWRGYEDGMTDAQQVHEPARAVGGEEQQPSAVSSPMTHKPEQEQSR